VGKKDPPKLHVAHGVLGGGKLKKIELVFSRRVKGF